MPAWEVSGPVAATAALRSSDPAPVTLGVAAGEAAAVFMNRLFTWSGLSCGCASRRSAAAPDVTAAAKDVPDPLKYASPTRPVGNWVSIVDPGARRETTDRPGAIRSGLAKPSPVGPTPEKPGTVSSLRPVVPASSTAPTVITSGSSPGFVTVPTAGPRLPADTTTTMPASHA